MKFPKGSSFSAVSMFCQVSFFVVKQAIAEIVVLFQISSLLQKQKSLSLMFARETRCVLAKMTLVKWNETEHRTYAYTCAWEGNSNGCQDLVMISRSSVDDCDWAPVMATLTRVNSNKLTRTLSNATKGLRTCSEWEQKVVMSHGFLIKSHSVNFLLPKSRTVETQEEKY